MVGAVTVLTRAVHVVSRGARGRGGWRETQTSSADHSGALSLGLECSGPEGPRQGRWGWGSGRAWARAEPGQSQGFSVLLSFGPSLTVTKFLHL